MTGTRTTRASVTFRHPFELFGFDRLAPPGTYDVDTEEEIIEGNDWTAYRRIATVLHLRIGGRTRMVTIDPEDLQFALTKDGEQ